MAAAAGLRGACDASLSLAGCRPVGLLEACLEDYRSPVADRGAESSVGSNSIEGNGALMAKKCDTVG